MAINQTPPPPLSILVMDLKSLDIDSRATYRRCCPGVGVVLTSVSTGVRTHAAGELATRSKGIDYLTTIGSL